VDTVRRVIDVVLPALDESLALPHVLPSIPAEYHAIVVDNGSRDDTATRAAELGAQVVSEPVRGFGAACFAGLVAARSEIVAFMDCDASLDARELPRVCAPILGERADLVLGARRPGDRGAWPVHGRVANSVLARTVSRMTGACVTDLGPMRAARRLALLDLGIEDRRFGWPLEMVLRAGHAGWRIEEVPVAYAPRVGRSKVTGSLRGNARAVVDMARVLARTRSKSGRA
jgi:glycosyltransferase involved in cell wall biosynthesis